MCIRDSIRSSFCNKQHQYTILVSACWPVKHNLVSWQYRRFNLWYCCHQIMRRASLQRHYISVSCLCSSEKLNFCTFWIFLVFVKVLMQPMPAVVQCVSFLTHPSSHLHLFHFLCKVESILQWLGENLSKKIDKSEAFNLFIFWKAFAGRFLSSNHQHWVSC